MQHFDRGYDQNVPRVGMIECPQDFQLQWESNPMEVGENIDMRGCVVMEHATLLAHELLRQPLASDEIPDHAETYGLLHPNFLNVAVTFQRMDGFNEFLSSLLNRR